MEILCNPICIKCTQIAEIFSRLRNSSREINTTMTSDFKPVSRNMGVSRMRNEKYAIRATEREVN